MPERHRVFEQALRGEIEGEVRFDKISCALYSTDASVYQIVPRGVVIPKTRQDVVRTVRICREHGVPITARGGGTSQAGQAVGGGVQLDFSKYFNRLLELNADRRTVRVEPGIVLDELNAVLAPYGLQLPLDLSTSNRATIGGMIANNSSGTRSVVYGKTLDYVEELTVLLADGSIVEMRPLDSDEWSAKCAQDDTEGNCYRVVTNLAAEHADEIRRRYPNILRRVAGYNLDEFLAGDGPPRPAEELGFPQTSRGVQKIPGMFSLARLIVGSEGTIGLVLQAKLRLVPLPAAKTVCVVHFHDLLKALAATPVILEHGPSAVELLDRFILRTTEGKREFERQREFIQGDPAAVLIVEFSGESAGEECPGHSKCPEHLAKAAELPARVERLVEDLKRRNLGYAVHRAPEPAAQTRIWALRRAALGLSMSQRGDGKAISFVEDTAVPPQRLRDYIERFLEILGKHKTQAGFYAHASVGLLHIRPVVNLKTADGVETFRRIAEEVADLVLEFGGALSGEHGDGLVRAPFLAKMFGPELYEAFCQIKGTFDPGGLFNPGKITAAPPITENLRFGAGYVTRELDTAFDFSDFGGMQRAAEQCGGVGACRKTLAGTMCPSYMATREEADSTRGRANVLRLAISGGLGAGLVGAGLVGAGLSESGSLESGSLESGSTLSDPELLGVLDLCLECKACQRECPTGVDMARLKAEFLYQYQREHGVSRRSRLLADVAKTAVWGSRLAPISNWLLGSGPVRWLGEKCYGLDRHRIPPAFVRETFLDWWRREKTGRGLRAEGQEPETGQHTSHALGTSPLALGDSSDRPRLALFVDTFTNHFEPWHGKAAVRLAERFGWRVTVCQRVCCGRPLISKGLLDEAARQAELTARALFPLAEQGVPILFCEPSCYSAVVDDHPRLVRGAAKALAERVRDACVTVEEWIEKVVAAQDEFGESSPLPAGTDALSFRVAADRHTPAEILLHGHCHQKALVGLGPALGVLSRIPDARVFDLDAGCCGMAGSFGMEREHYDISRTIGERKLFPAIRERDPAAVVAAPGFSCRHQIRHFTGVEAVSPVELLASLFL